MWRTGERTTSGWGAPAAWLLIAAVVVGFTLLWNLGGYPLIQPDEGRNAEVAREMKSTGAWLVPTLNGVPYLDKPALYFNLVALSLDFFGDREFAARLPSALFSIGTLALVLWFCGQQYGRLRGVIAVVIIATSPLFVGYARTVIFDSALAFFVTASILAGYLAEASNEKDRPRWYALFAAAAAAATLTKGPVGLLIPSLVLITFHLWAGRPAAIRRIYSARNVIVFIALVAPWSPISIPTFRTMPSFASRSAATPPTVSTARRAGTSSSGSC